MFSSYDSVKLSDALKRAKMRCDKILRLKNSALNHEKRGETSLARMDAKSYVLQKRQKDLYYTAASICQSLLTLLKTISEAKGKNIPQDILEPLHTYLFLRDRLQIEEFQTIDKQIKSKFGNIKCDENQIVRECISYAATAVSEPEIENAMNEIKGITTQNQQPSATPAMSQPTMTSTPVEPSYPSGPAPNFIPISNEPNVQQFQPGQSDFIQPSAGVIPPGGFIPPPTQPAPINQNIGYPNFDPSTGQPPIIPTNNPYYPPPDNNYQPQQPSYPPQPNYPPNNNNYQPQIPNYPPPNSYPPPDNNYQPPPNNYPPPSDFPPPY